MAPVQFVGGNGEAERGEATQQRPEGELALHAGERRTETVMDAVSEREVAALGSIDVELRPGRAYCPLSRLAAARQMMTWAPAGIVTPPMSTGATA